MQIKERTLDAVTILDLKGKITHEDHEILSKAIGKLLEAGLTRVVLNLAGVANIDSVGLSVLAHMHMMVSRRGARLSMCEPTQSIQNVLRISRLSEVFDVYEGEDMARLLQGDDLEALCPACEPASWISVRSGSEYQSCRRCGIELKLPPWPSVPQGGEAVIDCAILRSPTYDGEYVHLEIAEMQRIVFDNRLDLFASEAAERLWRLLPPPRRVLFGVGQGTFTDDGLQALLKLCVNATDESRAAIAITGLDDTSRDKLPKHPAVHYSVAAAARALDTGSQLPRIRLRVRHS